MKSDYVRPWRLLWLATLLLFAAWGLISWLVVMRPYEAVVGFAGGLAVSCLACFGEVQIRRGRAVRYWWFLLLLAVLIICMLVQLVVRLVV